MRYSGQVTIEDTKRGFDFFFVTLQDLLLKTMRAVSSIQRTVITKNATQSQRDVDVEHYHVIDAQNSFFPIGLMQRHGHRNEDVIGRRAMRYGYG